MADAISRFLAVRRSCHFSLRLSILSYSWHLRHLLPTAQGAASFSAFFGMHSNIFWGHLFTSTLWMCPFFCFYSKYNTVFYSHCISNFFVSHMLQFRHSKTSSLKHSGWISLCYLPNFWLVSTYDLNYCLIYCSFCVSCYFSVP